MIEPKDAIKILRAMIWELPDSPKKAEILVASWDFYTQFNETIREEITRVKGASYFEDLTKYYEEYLKREFK